MTLRRLLIVAVALGTLMPVCFYLLEIGLSNGFAPWPMMIRAYIIFAEAAVWPSSLPLRGVGSDLSYYSVGYLMLFGVSLLVNVMIYVVLALLIWLGLKFKPLIVLPVTLVVAYWTLIAPLTRLSAP